jgi:hypothetical protein
MSARRARGFSDAIGNLQHHGTPRRGTGNGQQKGQWRSGYCSQVAECAGSSPVADLSRRQPVPPEMDIFYARVCADQQALATGHDQVRGVASDA